MARYNFEVSDDLNVALREIRNELEIPGWHDFLRHALMFFVDKHREDETIRRIRAPRKVIKVKVNDILNATDEQIHDFQIEYGVWASNRQKLVDKMRTISRFVLVDDSHAGD